MLFFGIQAILWFIIVHRKVHSSLVVVLVKLQFLSFLYLFRCRIFSSVLFISNIFLSESTSAALFEYRFEWNEDTNSLFLGNEELPTITLLEGNEYLFYKPSRLGGKLSISDINGTNFDEIQDFNGSFLANNHVWDEYQYILVSPDSNTPRQLSYHINSNSAERGQINILPYLEHNPVFSSHDSVESSFSTSLSFDSVGNLYAGDPSVDNMSGKVFFFQSINTEPYLIYESNYTNPFIEQRAQFGAQLDNSNGWLFVGAPDFDNYRGTLVIYQTNPLGGISGSNTPSILSASGYQPGYLFGWRMASNPSFLAVSALDLSGNSGGQVELYQHDQGAWSSVGDFTSPTNINTDLFGYDLDIDNSYLVVGSPGTNNEKGMAHLIYLDQQNDLILSIQPNDLDNLDRFGHSVAISGNRLFVSSPFSDSAGFDKGAVYVYEITDENEIEYKTILTAENTTSNFHFGTNLYAKGNHLFVLSTSSLEPPFCLVFREESSLSDWSIVARISLADSMPHSESLDVFSGDLAFNNGFLAIGSPQAVSSTGKAVGAFQTFFNPAWDASPFYTLPPIFLDNNITALLGTEDGNKVEYHFRAIHPNGDQLFWDINSTNANAEIWELNSTSGHFSYTPPPDFNGTHEFSLRLQRNSEVISHNFEVNIAGLNDPSIYYDINNTQLFSTVGVEYLRPIEVLDIDSNFLTLSAKQLPQGLFIDPETFSIKGMPITEGNYSFELFTFDGENNVSNTYLMEVSPANSSPIAKFEGINLVNAISLSLPEDFLLSDWDTALSSFDINDEDNHSIFMNVIEEPSNGVLKVSRIYESPSDIRYFPNLNYHGTDSFKIKFEDSHPNTPQYTSIDFQIDIISKNDAPSLSALPSPAVFNCPINELFMYTFQSSDVDSNFVSIDFTGLPNWLNFDGFNRIVGVPSEQDFISQKEFLVFLTIKDSDGAEVVKKLEFFLSSSVSLPLFLNSGPLNRTIAEDSNLSDSIMFSYDGNYSFLQSQITQVPSYGEVIIALSVDKINFTYIPEGNFTGSDEFKIRVFDSRFSESFDELAVRINVTPEPDAPQFKEDFIGSVILDRPFLIPIEILESDEDDIVTLSRFYLDEPPNWLVALHKVGEKSWVLSGTPDSMKSVALNLILSDGNASVERLLNIEVIEDPGSLSINEQAFQSPIILNEDSEWFFDENLSVSPVNSLRVNWEFINPPSLGTFNYTESINGVLTNLSYKPFKNLHGSDRVVIQASNGYSSDFREFNFSIQSTPDNPQIIGFPNEIFNSRDEIYSLEVGVLDDDGIEDLDYEFINFPEWMEVQETDRNDSYISLLLSGVPNVSDVGIHSVKLVVRGSDDNFSTDDNFSINVLYGNQPPVPEVQTLNLSLVEDEKFVRLDKLLATDFETPDDQLVWLVLEQPNRGRAAIDPDGNNFTFIPESNSSFSENFTLAVQDNGYDNFLPRTTTIPVSVTLSQIDDPLYFSSIPTTDTTTGYEWNDESNYIYEVEVFDSDWPWQGYPIVKLRSSLPSWANWVELGQGKALLSGFPSYKDEGTYKFTIEADSGGSSVTQEFHLKIRVDDSPPIFRNSQGDASQKFSVSFLEDLHDNQVNNLLKSIKVTNDDYDVTTDTSLQWSIHSEPSNGGVISEFSFLEDTQESYLTGFSYNPLPNFHGVELFQLRVDEGDRFSMLPFEIIVKPVADPPYFDSNIDYEFFQNKGTYFQLEIDAFDADNEALRFILINSSNSPPWLKILSNSYTSGKSTVVLGGEIPVNFGNTFYYTVVAIDPTNRFSTKELKISSED